MTWPERYDPFGVPTTKDEFQSFVLWTAAGTLLYGAGYAAGVWRTIPRMASHHYANPSRNAIIRAAMRQTIWPSLSNAGKIALVSGGMASVALGGLAIVEGAMAVGSVINYLAPTVRDPDTGLSSYESYLQGSSVMDADPSHPYASWWGTD